MNTKKEYKAPELNVVEFKVEKGFAFSPTQNVISLGEDINRPRPEGINWNPFNVRRGYYNGNNDDWD